MFHSPLRRNLQNKKQSNIGCQQQNLVYHDQRPIHLLPRSRERLCQQKTNTRSAKHYKDLFDILARGIVQYQQRIVCMDASVALWAVVPELRARGVLVTMVSFFPLRILRTRICVQIPSGFSSLGITVPFESHTGRRYSITRRVDSSMQTGL